MRRFMKAFVVFVCLLSAYVSVGLGAPAAGSTAQLTLLNLALERFTNDLRIAEQELFKAPENNGIAHCDALTDRVIRADRLAWLCMNPTASAAIGPRLALIGARIENNLVLWESNIPFRLGMNFCEFSGDINISGCHLRSFFLQGGSCMRLVGYRVTVDEDVMLLDFRADGLVQFAGAHIGGDLQCPHMTCTNGSGITFCLNDAQIGGSVLLEFASMAAGEVQVERARITRDLNCSYGNFFNPGGFALNIAETRVEGNVILKSTNVKGNGKNGEAGALNLEGVTIGRNLDCEGGRFLCVGPTPSGSALKISSAMIEGSVILRSCTNEGQTSLAGSKIGRNLNCANTRFIYKAVHSPAFDASEAQIKGDVSFETASVEGGLDLTGASIDGTFLCSASHFSAVSPLLGALRLDGAEVKRDVLLNAGFTATGCTSLANAKIGGDLDCRAGLFTAPMSDASASDRSSAVDARGAKITGRLLLARTYVHSSPGELRDFKAVGTIDLESAKVGVLCDDTNSWPTQGNLILNNFTYDGFESGAPTTVEDRKRWLRLMRQDRFFSQPYQQLAGIYRSVGREEDAKEVLIAMNDDRVTGLTLASRILPRIFGIVVGYGYRPWRAAGYSAFFIFLGWFLFSRGYHANVLRPTDTDKAYPDKGNAKGEQSLSKDYPAFNAFIYSLENFVPLLNLEMGKDWRPNANLAGRFKLWRWSLPVSGTFLRCYLWFHIMLGWVLTTLWVGALTGLVKS